MAINVSFRFSALREQLKRRMAEHKRLYGPGRKHHRLGRTHFRRRKVPHPDADVLPQTESETVNSEEVPIVKDEAPGIEGDVLSEPIKERIVESNPDHIVSSANGPQELHRPGVNMVAVGDKTVMEVRELGNGVAASVSASSSS